MILENVNIFTEEKQFVYGDIVAEGSKIREVIYGKQAGRDSAGGNAGSAGDGQQGREHILDGRGCYAIPGMIDLHFHGCRGYDFCDGTREAMDEIAKYEASIGVTAICPATMTLPVQRLMEILSCAASYREEQRAEKASGRAKLVGINMEGPFISRAKKGAQDERYILPCDAGIFHDFQRAAGGLIQFIGIAPDEGDVNLFIQEVKDSVTVSLAHTGADYETAMAAFVSGASHVVHLYNAMTGFHHREPGVVGAAFDREDVTAEIICDGIHVHPAAVRTAFREMGAERLILISDSMRASGLSDGVYTLGGLEVMVEGRKATLVSDGSLAGSVTSLPDCVRYCVKKGHIPLEDAIACATVNPAKRLGLYGERGSITADKAADIVLLDEDLHLRAVVLDGEVLQSPQYGDISADNGNGSDLQRQ